MHYRTTAATLTVAAVALAGLTACSSKNQTVKTAPDATATATSAPANPAATTKPALKASPKPTTAGIGDTMTVTGEEGVKLTITLKKWTTTVHSGNEFITPDTGKTWVAGQFEIKNLGTVVYDDSPDNCVQAADAQGQRFDSAYMDSITAGPGMPSDVKLAQGDKALGWIVFEVPKGTKITKVQYTPNSGFGDQTAQWAIK